ncbi:metalloregulator ArsR/SmtB family transcription factor [Actinacidiphila sp. DG2A-62]|uniref:ArsR/SmtB family transcription factor n=1 Tax=Actinacidiphila sp. DG2A-62 TaxID=3108821 RepID=UPI002DBF09AC|nr:metalloregulator ArsR/SmtB family transcription factor [Actinacidiphila sp. DG2A-62]MEC3994227.1 metalloregulator ArsR/SmtB family transcription factor [Actinacidiphila sp. DG2A-62]
MSNQQSRTVRPGASAKPPRTLPLLGADDEGGGGGGTAACCPAIASAPLDEERAADLAKVFKALGDPVRLRLLSMIASREGGEVCVCELTPAFDLAQPTISHHLKLLRQAGLIDCERRGTWVYYWALPAALERLASVLGAPPDRVPRAGAPRRAGVTA